MRTTRGSSPCEESRGDSPERANRGGGRRAELGVAAAMEVGRRELSDGERMSSSSVCGKRTSASWRPPLAGEGGGNVLDGRRASIHWTGDEVVLWARQGAMLWRSAMGAACRGPLVDAGQAGAWHEVERRRSRHTARRDACVGAPRAPCSRAVTFSLPHGHKLKASYINLGSICFV